MRHLIILAALAVSAPAWGQMITCNEGGGVTLATEPPHCNRDAPDYDRAACDRAWESLARICDAEKRPAPRTYPVAIGTNALMDTISETEPAASPDELKAASTFNAEVPSHGPLWHTDTSCPGRAYTLDEIDQMRAAVTEIMNGPSDRQEAAFIKQNPHTAIIGNPWPRAKDTAIEDRLRTYMQAGVSPEALEAKAKGK